MEWIKVEGARLKEAADRAAQALARGGVIIFPAERLYGLGADARIRDAVLKVFALKGRDPGVPLSVVVGDEDQAREWAEFPDPASALARDFWPGPLTLVLPLKKALPEEVAAGGRELGIRVPGVALAREIARRLRGPVTATSANQSGKEPARDAREAASGLSGEADLVLDGGVLPGPPASTVIRVVEGRFEVLRKGVISKDELESSLRGGRSR